MKLSTLLSAFAIAGSICSTQVFASLHTVQFVNITNNGSQDIASQLTVDIMDQAGVNAAGFGGTVTLGAGELLFLFKNVGSIASAVSEIYLDSRPNPGGPVTSQSTLYNSLVGSTTFVGGSAAPPNLPGGATLTPAFSAVSAFSADAVGNPSVGLNPGEAMGIEYSVSGGFAGIVGALADGSLRIGLHVRAIDPDPRKPGDYSDSFVSTSPVPEPGTFAVWGLLAFAGYFGMKKVQARV